MIIVKAKYFASFVVMAMVVAVSHLHVLADTVSTNELTYKTYINVSNNEEELDKEKSNIITSVSDNSAKGIEILGSIDEVDGNFWYSKNDDGLTATITGYNGTKSGALKIPDEINGLIVNKIGNSAFENCSDFTGELFIPDNVTVIEPYAFYGCKGFTGIYISENTTTIGKYAFYGCSGFTGDLRIPDSVTNIGDNSFEGCCGLKGKLVLGKNIQEIGKHTFSGCDFSGDLIIPDSVTSIGEFAFCYLNGRGYTDSSNTKPYFSGKLSLGKRLKKIGWGAFYGCSGFTGDLVIPESIESLGSNVFAGCSGLNGNLVFPKNMCKVYSSAKGLFSGCSFTGNLVIPQSWTCIPDGCFGQCKFTGDLIIPDNIEEIGSHAFLDCNTLSGNLVIGNNVKTIDRYAFCRCSGFSGSLDLPNNITIIGVGAFEGCSGFNGHLIIPDSVIDIGESAFGDCDGFIGSLTIPSGVTHIGYSPFRGCSNIKRVVNDSLKSVDLPNIKYHPWENMEYKYVAWKDEETGESITTIANGIAVRDDYDITDDLDDAHPTTLYFGSRGVSFNFIWSPGKLLNSREAADRDLAQICLILSSKIYKVDGDYNGARNNVDKALADLNLVECSAEQLSIAGDKCKTRWYEHHSLFPPHVFALKRYTYNGETYNLITVIIRGTNGEIRDYVVDAMPEGFIKASQYVYEDLKNFLDVNGIDIIDSHNRYLITGHSMGGAVANLLQFYILDSSMDVMNDRDVVLSDGITCYTYASPYTMWGYYRGDSGFGFAKNYIYPEDVVPVTTNNFGDFFEGLAEYVKANSLTGKLLEKCQLYRPKEYKPMRYGTDIILGGITDSVKALFKQYTGTDYDLYVESDKNDENHCCDTYMALIRASIDNGVFGLVNKYILKRRILSVYCPVNIDVVDKLTGEVVASITDNKITAIKDEKIKLFIMGDEKFVSIPSDFGYSVRLTGSDEGTMDFVIQDVCQDDNGIYLSNTSRFDNVALTKGKVMESPIETTVSTSNLKLFVLDGNGKAVKTISEDGTETDYLPKAQDGDKSSDNEDSKSNNGETGTSTTADTGLKPIETQYKSIVNVKDILLPYYTKSHPDVVVKKTKFKSSDKKTVKINKKGIAKGGKKSGSAIITMFVKTEETVTKPNGKQKKKLSKWTSACTLDVNNTGKQGK